jgi:hypothetical protein
MDCYLHGVGDRVKFLFGFVRNRDRDLTGSMAHPSDVQSQQRRWHSERDSLCQVQIHKTGRRPVRPVRAPKHTVLDIIGMAYW